MKGFSILLSLIFSLFVFSEDDFYQENIFYEPNIEQIKTAYPGDIIFQQIKGYKSECWIVKKNGDNKYCTINKGVYCKVKADMGESIAKNFKNKEFNNIETSKAVAQKNFDGTIGIWKQSILVKGKKDKQKFACHNFTSFNQADLNAEKSSEKLGEIEKIEFLGKSGNSLRFLYFQRKIPINEEDLRTVLIERELEIEYTTDNILFYKGLVLEILSYEGGMIEYKVNKPFKS